MRRVLFWTLLLLFALLTAWWVMFVPRSPETLYKAVPHGATFVSAHARLAERWDDVSRNPIARSLLQSSGAKLEEVDKLSRDEEFRFWLERIASDEIVIAYVPYAHPVQSEIWVFASWLGGWSQRLRWILRSSGKHDCVPTGQHAGRTIWAVEYGVPGEKETAQFAFVEGAVIGCISDHPEAIRYVLDVYDGRAPGDADFYREKVLMSDGGPFGGDDRGWFATGRSRNSTQWSYALTDIGPAHLEGSLCTPNAQTADEAWKSELDITELSRLVGDIPFAAVVASPRGMLDLLNLWMKKDALQPVEKIVSDFAAQAVSLFVLDGEYSGRLKGLKWPGILAALQVDAPMKVNDVMAACLDDLNASHQWGLIRSQRSVGEVPLYVIESTADTFYAKLSASERLAYAVCGRWLVISSNASSLERLLARYQREESQSQGSGRWEQFLQESDENAAGFGWSDLERGGKALRLALSAYAVKLMFEDAENTQARRQKLNEAKAWIEAIVPLEDLHLRLEPLEGDVLRIAFELGSDESSESRQ